MIIRTEWSNPVNSDLYFTKDETINDVKDNFNIRRNFSAEGISVVVNNIEENVIIQDHTNPINADKADKKMLVPMDLDIQSGDYVNYRGETWIVISRINIVDDAYKSCQIYLCNWTLKFQSPDGTILSYPCIDETTQRVGEKETDVITLGDGVHVLTLPYDESTVLLRDSQRFMLDKHPTAPNVFKVTQNNTTTHNYGNKGLVKITVKQDELRSSEVDRVDLGICNYFEPTTTPTIPPESEKYSFITCSNSSNQVTIGASARTLTPTFYRDDVEVTDVVAIWTYVFPLGLENQFTKAEVAGTNKVKIGAKDNTNLIGKTVVATVKDESGDYESSMTLTVVSGF